MYTHIIDLFTNDGDVPALIELGKITGDPICALLIEAHKDRDFGALYESLIEYLWSKYLVESED